MNIWAAANMIMPARLAELVRPYLLQPRGAPFSTSFGAVMVERFFDLSGLLLLLAMVLWNTPQLPKIYTLLGGSLLAVLIFGYFLVLLMLARKTLVHSVVDKCLSIFPKRAASFMAGVFQRLIEGLGIMSSFSQVVIIASYSVMLWVLFSCITYLFLLAFSIETPFLVAVTIQVLMALGVALPAAPGFIGTFHAVGRYALALFGVNAVVAVSFATVYHLFGLGTSLLLGMVSYATSDFRFSHAMFESHSGPEEGMQQG
jgi:glycosyltransferase 2 family protein